VSFFSSASVGFNLAGLGVAWVTPTILMLLAADPPISMSADEESRMVLMLSLGSVLQVILLAHIRNVAGCKNILIFTTAPCLIAWLTTISVVSVEALYVTPFLIGVQITIALTVMPIYLTVSEIKIRRILKFCGTIILKYCSFV
jgi:hypothetical protein